MASQIADWLYAPPKTGIFAWSSTPASNPLG